MSVKEVCKFCGADATTRTAFPLTLSEDEFADWMKSGKRPGALSDDGMGEREETGNTSPVEAAYRRGVCQALFWAAREKKGDIVKAAELSLNLRFDGEVHCALLDELSHQIHTEGE